MIEANKSYRISTITGQTKAENIVIQTSLLQDIDSIDILSVSLKSIDAYRKHNANYGVVVGRVIANNGFGIPNAKISIFIEADSTDDDIMNYVYPFNSSFAKDENGVRYNLLPDNYVSDCHQVVGTFPNKRFMLDNDVLLEVFDKYYKFTAVTNRSGDYLICGVPVGNHTIHMDLDISDCGILSQRPRDFVYKGYNIEQFENANKFKEGTNYNELSQVFTQDRVVRVEPFWGNSENGETIGITRADIDVAFKFETTCVFMGSIGSDNASQGITEKCVPTAHMGDMDELVAGEGTIEMIRKTPNGKIEEFQIKGNQLINADGVWCYQIPMNLDYVMTDEYGNTVPTDDPNKGVATRAQVRFRISMQDSENAKEDFYRPKILVPNNPDFDENGIINYDYEFGSSTGNESFRDLFWNNVYSVKSFIPRFQKSKWYKKAWKDEEFSGIKHCNIFGANNPMPYNNFRVKTPFVFLFLCSVIRAFIYLVGKINTWIIERIYSFLEWLKDIGLDSLGLDWHPFRNWCNDKIKKLRYVNISDSFCPDLEGWFFMPDADVINYETLTEQTRGSIAKDEGISNGQKVKICVENNTNLLVTCVELNLANEYKVLNFDFYNDWINGFIYIPRVKHFFKSKSRFLGISFGRDGTQGCMTDKKLKWAWGSTRQYTQSCALEYTISNSGIRTPNSSKKSFHRDNVRSATIFHDGGICKEKVNSFKQRIFYLKPSEIINNMTDGSPRKVNLYANDLILLGSLNNCDIYGIPQAYKNLRSTSYILPPNLPITNLEDGTGQLFESISYENEDDESKRKCRTYTNQNGRIETYNAIEDEEGEEYVKSLFNSGESVDTVALTEVAGIAWNIDGPNQRPSGSGDKYYNPGGHFLKMSCWASNMEVKNKSCVNLSRICELGSSMSQRKKDANKIDGKDILYTNIVPTGFISNDNIVDGDARSMFATMNSKKLVAKKINEDTGYKIYDFIFLRANGFDGISKSMVSKEVGYNKEIDVIDEAQAFYEQYGAAYDDGSGIFNPDAYITKTKTFEDTLSDYVEFRFGVDRIFDANNKFLNIYNNNNVLPVFENSFYFYFGLNQGSTAIDEFNKTFFSNCESRLIKDDTPSLKAEVKCVHYGSGSNQDNVDVDVILTSENVPLPWTELTYTDGDDEYEPRVNDTNKFVFSAGTGDAQALKMKNYNFKLLYGEGIPLEANLNLVNHVKYNAQAQDFKVATNAIDGYLERNPENQDTEIGRGGWIVVESVDMPFLTDSEGKRGGEVPGVLKLMLVNDNKEHYANSAATSASTIINSDVDEPIYFFVPYSDTEYYVQLYIESINYTYNFKTIKVNRTTSGLLFLNKNGRTIDVPQDCKIDWWKNTSEYGTLVENLVPFMFDYRPREFKNSDLENTIRVPVVESRNSDLFYFGFPQKATQDSVSVKDDIFESYNDDEQQDGYEIDYNKNYAGGDYWSGRTTGLIPLNTYSFYGGGALGVETMMLLGNKCLIVQGNFYCFTTLNKKTDTFWHDKINNISITNTGEIVPSNDDVFNYIKAGYPVVVWEDESNYSIRKINKSLSNGRLKVDISGFNSPSKLVLYPFFVFPMFNRERTLSCRTFEYMRKTEDFYKLIYEDGESGIQEYKNAESFACPSLFQFKIKNPLNFDIPVELRLPGQESVRTDNYSANIYRKFNNDINVPDSGWYDFAIANAREYNPSSENYNVVVDNASNNGLDFSFGMGAGNVEIKVDGNNIKLEKKDFGNEDNDITFYLKTNVDGTYLETKEPFIGTCVDFNDDTYADAVIKTNQDDYVYMNFSNQNNESSIYLKCYAFNTRTNQYGYIDTSGNDGYYNVGEIFYRNVSGEKRYRREEFDDEFTITLSATVHTFAISIGGYHYSGNTSNFESFVEGIYVSSFSDEYDISPSHGYKFTLYKRPYGAIYNPNDVLSVDDILLEWGYDNYGPYTSIDKISNCLVFIPYEYYWDTTLRNTTFSFGRYKLYDNVPVDYNYCSLSGKIKKSDNGWIMQTNCMMQLFYYLINKANGYRSFYSIKNNAVDGLIDLFCKNNNKIFSNSNEYSTPKSGVKNLYVLAEKNNSFSSKDGTTSSKFYRLYKLM